MFTIPVTNHNWGSYQQLWQTKLFIKSIGVICDIGGYTQFQNNCAFGWFVWGETQFKITIISWSLRLTDHISTAHLVLFAYHIGFPELFGSIIPQEPPWCCWGLREETLVNSGIGLFFSVFPHWYMPKPDPQCIHGSSYIYICNICTYIYIYMYVIYTQIYILGSPYMHWVILHPKRVPIFRVCP